MESLVQYVSKNQNILDKIILSNEDSLLYATYKLFLHYGFSLEYIIKAGFRNEIEIQGINGIFRENRKYNHIVTEYFCNCGGKFDIIINFIKQIVRKNNAGKSTKGLRYSIIKSVDFMDKNLIPLMSDSLIDFCNDICVCINNKRPRAGEQIVCCFIIFRIFAVKLINNSTDKELPNIKEFIKILNKIAIGNADIENNYLPFTKLIRKQSNIFRNTIARAIMQRRNSGYCCQVLLSQKKFTEYCKTFLDRIKSLSFNDRKIPRATKSSVILRVKPQHEQSKRRSRSRTFDNSTNKIYGKSILRSQLMSPISASEIFSPTVHNHSINTITLNQLVKNASYSNKISSVGNNLKYFVLWNMTDVLRLISDYDDYVNFFTTWKINGYRFLQLNERTLTAMEITDKLFMLFIYKLQEQVKQNCIHDVHDLYKIPLIKWSTNDVKLWLILSNMDHLSNIAEINSLTGKDILSKSPNKLKYLGIYNPNDILKIDELKRLPFTINQIEGIPTVSLSNSPKTSRKLRSNYSSFPIFKKLRPSPQLPNLKDTNSSSYTGSDDTFVNMNDLKSDSDNDTSDPVSD